MSRWAVATLLGGLVAGAAYWRRALTLNGALAAAMVGMITFARGGLPAALALLAFFGSSSALSQVGEVRKQASAIKQQKGARRDAWQVLANGGVATVCIAFRQADGFLGALAAAGADTWATELGMLSRRAPRLITTFQEVPPGTSGGVTLQGLLASVGGALTVGVAWAGGSRRAQGISGAVLGGVGGALVDSLLGATLQARYSCPQCGRSTEASVHEPCGQPTILVHGHGFVTNDVVNALATLSGATISHLL